MHVFFIVVVEYYLYATIGSFEISGKIPWLLPEIGSWCWLFCSLWSLSLSWVTSFRSWPVAKACQSWTHFLSFWVNISDSTGNALSTLDISFTIFLIFAKILDMILSCTSCPSQSPVCFWKSSFLYGGDKPQAFPKSSKDLVASFVPCSNYLPLLKGSKELCFASRILLDLPWCVGRKHSFAWYVVSTM